MIFRATFSPLGRERALELSPDLDRDAIRLSQERITEWKRLELRGETPGAAEVPDLRVPLARLRKGAGSLDGRELYEFLPFLDHVGALRYLRDQALRSTQEIPRLAEILGRIGDFSGTTRRLRRSLSPSGEILDTASPELAQIRKDLHYALQHAAGLLEDMLGRITESREDSFVTLREGRYVISVRAQQRGAMPGLVHGRSNSGQSVLLEPFEAVEANNRVAEGREEEKREEARILAELSELLRSQGEALSDAFAAMGELDLIRAEALLALALRAEPPALNHEGRIRLVQARHPILAEAEDRGGARVVPLNLELLRERPVLLISGPNMGGKSVALKTVGLLELMAKAGLHVPAADGTDLPLVDSVFVDLGDEQSIEGDLSTFAGHLRNIGRVWTDATSDSLVLLDELGGGTDPEEGAALAMAILETLAARSTLTLATTHITSVKLFAGEQPRMQNAAMEFDAASFRPLFRLTIGEPGRSRAFEIARRILPDAGLLERAEAYRSPLLIGMDRLLGQVDREKVRLEEARAALERQAEDLRRATELKARQAERLRERLRKIRDDRRAALDRLYREAEEEIRSRREALEARIRAAEEASAQVVPAAVVPDLRRAERELSRRRLEARSNRRREVQGRKLSVEGMQPGRSAWLPDLEATVRILRIAADRAWVDWNGRRLEVAVSSLEEIPEGRAQVSASPPAVRIEEASPEPVGRELDLRGLRAEEALEKLDRFLDRASLQHLHQVRIVHGKGTGVLKREVEKHLEGHPLVTGFRMGELAEGGWGVTVAELGS